MTGEEFEAAIATVGVPLELATWPQYISPADPYGIARRQSVTSEEGMLLARWCEGLRVLEIGTGLGVATVCIASTAVAVATVDPDDWVHENIHLPAHVAMYRSTSDVSGEFDAAFIDGLHDEESVRADIEACRSRVASGGFVAFHDAHHGPVRAAIDAFDWSRREELSTLGHLTRCWLP